MTTGTVTMSLADIDKLRNDVLSAQQAEKELNKRIVEIEADKRVVKTTVYSGDKNNFRIHVDTYNMYSYLGSITEESFAHRHIGTLTPYKGYTKNRFAEDSIMRRFIDIIPINNEVKKEFVNFDDVKLELRQEIEKQFQDEIGTLRSDKRAFEIKLAETKEDNQKESVRLQKKHQEDIEYRVNQLSECEKRYKELEEGKKELSKIEELQKQLDDLNKLYYEERTKPWYKKLFS